jgi:hypothetical protein
MGFRFAPCGTTIERNTSGGAMAKAIPGGSGWRPTTSLPERSGIYAVHDGATGTDRFAVYCAESGEWGIPQTNLRLFNAMFAEQQADREPRHKAWRELTDNEMLSLSPTAQARAAGFLPAGAVILPSGAADRD